MPYPYPLLPLPYDFTALTPYLSPNTLYFHHDKHLATYVANLNRALSAWPDGQAVPLEELLRYPDRIPEAQRAAIVNNGGGVANHELYFTGMRPYGRSGPAGALERAINRAFGSFEEWRIRMKKAAMGQFGSGYAFLSADPDGALSVRNLPNQDSPFSLGLRPLLNVDVWEHAYYLDYQNRRGDYIDRWFSLIDWERAAARYAL